MAANCSDSPAWILDSMTTSLLVLDRELRLVYMNSAAEMLFGHSFRQSKGIALRDLAHPPETLLQSMQASLDSGHPFTERELCFTVSSGQIITVDCTVARSLRSSCEPELLIELQHVDRQLRINREEHLLAQQDTSRALVRNLAHEVKNPLGGLRGAAQLLEREFSDDNLKEYTRIIIREADRLRNLVDRMLGPTRPPDYRPVNIHEILEQVRQLVEAETGKTLEIQQDYDPSIPQLLGDFDQLIQAVLNIVQNAVHALDSKGIILLRTRIQRQQTIGHTRHKLLARLDIVDNGPGVPAPLQEKIFYPMISGQETGTGLGLSIAQLIVNQHGGLIEFSSHPGKTTFSLLLPLEPEELRGEP